MDYPETDKIPKIDPPKTNNVRSNTDTFCMITLKFYTRQPTVNGINYRRIPVKTCHKFKCSQAVSKWLKNKKRPQNLRGLFRY